MLCLRASVAVVFVIASERVCAQPAGSGQRPDTMAIAPPAFIGSPVDDHLRVARISSAVGAGSLLARTASSLAYIPASRSWRDRRMQWVTPLVDVTWNSALPHSWNDGAAWAGRGLTALVSGGVQASLGRVHLNLIPQLWRTQNLPVPVLPGGDPTRSAFASPWHAGLVSADLPQRFGYDATTELGPGESALWMDARGLSFGLSAESQWWGPGIRNALVMSNNAGGVPHAFLATRHPARTPIGDFEGRWIIGGLSESRFFDSDAANDLRSLSGAAMIYTPRLVPDLDLGWTRVVYAPVAGAGALPARALDVFARWGGGFNVRWAGNGRDAEQLSSLFARLALPASAAEVYGEWGRILLPTSVRSFLIAPQFTQGFTVGAQWLPALRGAARLRVQAEVTNLEQSPDSRAADTLSFYASSVVPQGYTHRGQVVGASIGPGSSSQFIAVDHLAGERSIGVFAGRVRWDTDAYYLQPTSLLYLAYDVTLMGGVRASDRVAGRWLSAELAAQHRYNYLFQNSEYGYSRDGAFDATNLHVRLRLY